MDPGVAEWRRRVVAEYRSAAAAAQVLSGLIHLGAARPLLETARRVVGDELDHAELSHACVEALGGGEEPVDLPEAWLAGPAAPWLPALAQQVLESFCFGETLAVPLFREMRASTTHPVCRAALDRILRDEAVHRRFAWEALDALLEVAPGLRPSLLAAVPELRSSFQRAYAHSPGHAELTPALRAVGLLDLATYASVFESCWREDLGPRLARRGLLPPSSAPEAGQP